MLLLSAFTLPFGKKLSEVVYFFIKLKGEDNINWFGSMSGHGKEYCFYFLLLLSLVFVLVYYFIVASKVQNATKQNYRGIFIMGYITLAVLSCVGIAAFVSPSAVATLPMLQICLWDLLWYTLLYESWSLLFKGWSNAQNIHLTNCWK